MKIVVAYGGLGNMMFQYALVLKLRSQGNKTILFVADSNSHHNGYELEKVFCNISPKYGINWLQRKYYQTLEKIRDIKIKGRQFPHPILFFPFHRIKENCPIIFYKEALKYHGSAYYIGHYQCYDYFSDIKELINKEYTFNLNLLNNNTKKLWQIIERDESSVAIHIRGGDYQSAFYIKTLGNVCSTEYYKRAINEITKKISNPHFYIFSDDFEFVSKNFELKNAVFVDINKGEDSWQDMFLMSKCKHNIIANSSFSWWAAWLNLNKQKTIIAPKIWISDLEEDNIIPPSWIRM